MVHTVEVRPLCCTRNKAQLLVDEEVCCLLHVWVQEKQALDGGAEASSDHHEGVTRCSPIHGTHVDKLLLLIEREHVWIVDRRGSWVVVVIAVGSPQPQPV